MKHQASRDLYAYWNRLRRGRSAPERTEIEPTAIREVLADTFMLDIDAAARFPVRLAGTRFNGLFDADQKGRSFLELWRAEERRNVAAVLMTVADGSTPVVAGSVALPLGQSESASFEFLFLPLRHHGKTHARILGIVTAAAAREPAWLGLLPAGPMALRSLRMIEDVRQDSEAMEVPLRVAAGGRADPGFAGTSLAMPATGSLLFGTGPTHTRPALRLIQGGRPV